MQREERDTNLTGPIIDTDIVKKILTVFVTEHFRIIVLVEMVQPCLVRVKNITQLFVILFGHKGL